MKKFLKLFIKPSHIRILINKIQPNFLKTYFPKKLWSKVNFKNTDTNKIEIYNNNNDKIIVDEINHQKKSELIFNEIHQRSKIINKILEFGCNYGVNLKNFLDKNVAEVVGIDLNNVVKGLENNYINYKGIVGDELYLKNFNNGYFDVAFTCSVLDHFPDEKKVISTIKELKRISKNLYLFEPYLDHVVGDVSYYSRYEISKKYRLNKKFENEHMKFGKNSFFWNYDKYLKDLGLNFKKKEFPLHFSSMGPYYHVYYVNNSE